MVLLRKFFEIQVLNSKFFYLQLLLTSFSVHITFIKLCLHKVFLDLQIILLPIWDSKRIVEISKFDLLQSFSIQQKCLIYARKLNCHL
jgi:hypothetical protein